MAASPDGSDWSRYEFRELELERKKLWKTYKHMNRHYAKSKLCFESDLKKNREIIADLENTNQQLRDEYCLVEVRQGGKVADHMVAELQTLCNQKTNISEDMIKQQDKLARLKRKTAELQLQIVELKPEEREERNPKKVMQRLNQQETKVKAKNQTLSMTLLAVNKLRAEVNGLRKVRAIYMEMLSHAQTSIEALMKENKQVTAEGMAAYQITEDVQAKIRHWEEVNEKEQSIYRTKKEDLLREMHGLEKQTRMLEILAQDKTTMAKQLKMERIEFQMQLRLENQRAQLADYQDKWKKVCAITGSDQVKLALQEFGVKDTVIYSIMLLCSSQKMDIDWRTNENKKLRAEIERLKKQRKMEEEDHTRQLITLDQTTRDVQSLADRAEDTLSKVGKTLAEVLVFIRNFFDKLHCDPLSLENPFYRDEGLAALKNLNCREFMIVLALKIRDYLTAHDFLSYQALEGYDKMLLTMKMKEQKSDRKSINLLTEGRNEGIETLMKIPRMPDMAKVQLDSKEIIQLVDVKALRQKIQARYDRLDENKKPSLDSIVTLPSIKNGDITTKIA